MRNLSLETFRRVVWQVIPSLGMSITRGNGLPTSNVEVHKFNYGPIEKVALELVSPRDSGGE